MTSKTILPRSYSDDAMKRQYARVAWFYDGWGRLTEDRALQRLLTLTDVKDGMNILEVAVGTGRLFERLVKLNPSGNTEGIDISSAMLDHARQRLQRRTIPGAYHLQEGSAYTLPYESAGFDLLFNTYMLDMFPVADHPRVLKEFLRVLKPGGKLAIAYFSHGHKQVNRLWPWVARHFPDLLAGCRPVDLEKDLLHAGTEIQALESISQNSFPSDIVIAQKRR